MTTALTVPVADALDALARADEGTQPLPGDPVLTAAYERYCQQAWDEFQHARHVADRRAQVASASADHQPDCDGPDCDHWTHEEVPA